MLAGGVHTRVLRRCVVLEMPVSLLCGVVCEQESVPQRCCSLRGIFHGNACNPIRWKPDDKLLSSFLLDWIFFAKTLSMV